MSYTEDENENEDEDLDKKPKPGRDDEIDPYLGTPTLRPHLLPKTRDGYFPSWYENDDNSTVSIPGGQSETPLQSDSTSAFDKILKGGPPKRRRVEKTSNLAEDLSSSVACAAPAEVPPVPTPAQDGSQIEEETEETSETPSLQLSSLAVKSVVAPSTGKAPPGNSTSQSNQQPQQPPTMPPTAPAPVTATSQLELQSSSLAVQHSKSPAEVPAGLSDESSSAEQPEEVQTPTQVESQVGDPFRFFEDEPFEGLQLRQPRSKTPVPSPAVEKDSQSGFQSHIKNVNSQDTEFGVLSDPPSGGGGRVRVTPSVNIQPKNLEELESASDESSPEVEVKLRRVNIDIEENISILFSLSLLSIYRSSFIQMKNLIDIILYN